MTTRLKHTTLLVASLVLTACSLVPETPFTASQSLTDAQNPLEAATQAHRAAMSACNAQKHADRSNGHITAEQTQQFYNECRQAAHCEHPDPDASYQAEHAERCADTQPGITEQKPANDTE